MFFCEFVRVQQIYAGESLIAHLQKSIFAQVKKMIRIYRFELFLELIKSKSKMLETKTAVLYSSVNLELESKGV